MKNTFPHSLLKKLLSLRSDAAGATAIEYGLLASLIGIAIIGGVSATGDNVSMLFGNFAAMLDDSYAQQVVERKGIYTSDGVEYTYDNITTINANGSRSYDDTLTSANGNETNWSGLLTYNGAIGGGDWTEQGTTSFNGTVESSYTQTNTGETGNVVQTNDAGQTRDYSYNSTSDGNGGWDTTDTGTNYNGQEFTNTYDHSSTQTSSATSTRTE